MNKKLENNKLLYLKILVGIFIFNFFIFTKYYYNKITLESLLNHYVIVNNNVIECIVKFLDIVIKNSFTSHNITIILFITTINYMIKKYDLIDLIKNISSFQINGFKVECANLKDDLKKISNDTKEQIQKLENDPTKHEKEIRQNKTRLELVEIMIDEPYIVEIINAFLNKKIRRKNIPWKIFKDKMKISSISKIFDYEMKADCIRIKDIKDDIKDELAQVYGDLINKGIIYGQV